MIRGTALLAVGVLVGFWLDDPADRVRTVTTTERVEVEVPGPTVVRSEPLPETCERMIEAYLRQVENIKEYADAIGPQQDNLVLAQQAIGMGSVDLQNQAITAQSEIELSVAGPLASIIQAQDNLTALQEQCEADRGE